MVVFRCKKQDKIPGGACGPAKASNNISVAIPLEGEGASVQVGLESSRPSVVVLNIVQSAGTLLNGDWLSSLIDRSSHGTKAADQSNKGGSELHVGRLVSSVKMRLWV